MFQNSFVKVEPAQALPSNPLLPSDAAKSALDSIVHLATYDPNSLLNCPHDLPHDSVRAADNMDTYDNQQPETHDQVDAAASAALSLTEILIKVIREKSPI